MAICVQLRNWLVPVQSHKRSFSLEMSFFLMVLIFFFFSPQGLHSSVQMFLLFCYCQAHDVYPFPGNQWNQHKSPVTIEHIFTEINLMSLLQFDTVQLSDLSMQHETILTNYICLKDLFLLKYLLHIFGAKVPLISLVSNIIALCDVNIYSSICTKHQ